MMEISGEKTMQPNGTPSPSMRYQPTLVDNYQQTKERIAQIGRQYDFGDHVVIDGLHQLRTSLADFRANREVYVPLLDADVAKRAGKNLAKLEKDLDTNIKRLLGNLHATGIAFARTYHAAREWGEREEAGKKLAVFSGEYIDVAAKVEAYGYKTDKFLKRYAALQADTYPERAVERVRKQWRDAETLEDVTRTEEDLQKGEEARLQQIRATKRALFWTYVPLAQWRLLGAHGYESKTEFARAREELEQVTKNFTADEKEYADVGRLVQTMQHARKQLEKTTPSLDASYVTLLAERLDRRDERWFIFKDNKIRRFADAARTLDAEKEKLKTAYETGIRAVERLTISEAGELKKTPFDVSFTPETKKRYENAVMAAEQLQEKRGMLGLKTLDDLAALKTTLARNVEEIERHLDSEKRIGELRQAYETKMADVERAKDGLLALKEAELATRTADIKKAESSVAQREAELAGLNARIAGVEQQRAQEEAQRLETDAALRQKEGELAAERRVREQTVGELTRAKGALSTTQETLRQQQEASAVLAAEREAEAARRHEAEEQVRTTAEQARLAEERAQLMEQEARRVVEEAQRVAAEAEARTAAERAASNAAQEHEETVFSPARAVVLGDGKILWL